ncbi:MAG: carboxymuconolactone decarboxylase family protein [bacterium]|nr:carboxymuconolactone decarboxylase family protein [bacterium]MDE0669383.1 carboxymuconolactone decarboxylase family protein [bacterium]MXZ31615.1 carboxymuconolactone decarboxylase family protein [Acidimicrobiia bacterium]MYE66736.1 carboxymuconolactone decarboxylase family protein [Acidimicrobiia bacterium]MYJ14088.1 carboxymuconolactone decarboxylase family protein [Acidimicrobiia bacterium]
MPDLSPEALSADQARLYGAVAGGDRARDASFRLTEADGSLVGPFGALLLSPAVGDALQQVGAAIRFGCGLSPVVREVAILAVAAHWRSGFEWWAHEPIARRAGLTDQQIAALKAREAPEFEDSAVSAAHAFSAALIAGGRPDDATFEAAREALGLDGAMELVTLVGYYNLLAQLMQTFDIEVPTGEPSPF